LLPAIRSSDTLAAQLGLHQGSIARPMAQPEQASGGTLSGAAGLELGVGAASVGHAGFDRISQQSFKRQRRADSPDR